jgi:uncharacterized membrane protein YsdA (DUF1294 family)
MNIYIILTSIALINFITFIVYGIDKYKARKGKWRISENSLLLLAVIGGSIGAWLGIKIWHHKTMHKKFCYGIPLVILVQVAILTYFFLIQQT